MVRLVLRGVVDCEAGRYGDGMMRGFPEEEGEEGIGGGWISIVGLFA